MDRCREGNIKLNKKKFIFKCDGVQFIGHRLTKEGLKPDPAKLRAILNMKKPDDVAAVHSRWVWSSTSQNSSVTYLRLVNLSRV